MSLLEWLKDIVASLNESPEAKEELEDLRKEIAKGYLEKLEKEKPDILLMFAKDQVLDYLIDDWIADKFHDAIVGKTITSISGLSSDLKEFREKLNKASTKEELETLKSQIISPENLPQNEVWEGTFTQLDNTQTPEENKDWNQTSDVSSSAAIPQNEKKENFSSQISSEEKKENLGNVEWFDVNKIESCPARKNPKTWVTLCAATAKFNAKDTFWLKLPSGNAWDASTARPIDWDYKESLPKGKEEERPKRSWNPLTIQDFDAIKGVNVADIYPDSKSGYWHRAIAFRDQNGEWMVLDPYIKVSGTESTDPKPLKDYVEKRPVLKAHFYAVEDDAKRMLA